jgi:hypothetical protein
MEGGVNAVLEVLQETKVKLDAVVSSAKPGCDALFAMAVRAVYGQFLNSVDLMRRMLEETARSTNPSLDEALNSGDGSYRP